jgi:hypothetical protein
LNESGHCRLQLPIELEKNDLTAIEAPTRRDVSANVANFLSRPEWSKPA